MLIERLSKEKDGEVVSCELGQGLLAAAIINRVYEDGTRFFIGAVKSADGMTPEKRKEILDEMVKTLMDTSGDYVIEEAKQWNDSKERKELGKKIPKKK